jgi:hypothetical protein
MSFAVPAGWSFKGNYGYGLLLSPDYEPSTVESYPNPEDLSTAIRGTRISIEYVTEEVEPGMDSSEDFTRVMLEATSQAPYSEQVIVMPHAVTVGGVPMVNMGGLAFSDHGGRLMVVGRKNGKNIGMAFTFADSYATMKEAFDAFLSSFQFSK